MSQQHVEIIRAGTEAFNRGDWDSAIANVADDVVWGRTVSLVQTDAPVLGSAALVEAWAEQRALFGGDAFNVELSEITDLRSGTVLTTGRMTGQGTSSGATVEIHFASIWTFRNGKVVRFDNYPDRAAALAAVS